MFNPTFRTSLSQNRIYFSIMSKIMYGRKELCIDCMFIGFSLAHHTVMLGVRMAWRAGERAIDIPRTPYFDTDGIAAQ
jgi:hypothetical protein